MSTFLIALSEVKQILNIQQPGVKLGKACSGYAHILVCSCFCNVNNIVNTSLFGFELLYFLKRCKVTKKKRKVNNTESVLQCLV